MSSSSTAPPSGERWAAAHLLQAAHEVVADWGAGQVGGAGAAAHVEEVVRAEHGVVLLGVARGGQDPVHGDGDLHEASRGRGHAVLRSAHSHRHFVACFALGLFFFFLFYLFTVFFFF